MQPNNKYGLSFEELYEEFCRIIFDTIVACKEGANIDEATSVAAVYVTEIVKRWRTPGITVERVREGAEDALKRQTRKWKTEELKRLLGEEKEDGEESTGSSDKADTDKSPGDDSTQAGRTSDNAGGQPTDRAGEGDSPGSPDPQQDKDDGGSGVTDLPGSDKGVRTEGTARVESSGEPTEDHGGEVTVSVTCDRCQGPMPPSIDRGQGIKTARPLPPTVRRCPACGWDPKSGAPAPPGPEPPKAGKSFSGPKKRQ